MNNNRTNSFYKVNHRYNPRISDIIPDNTSNGLNLTRFYSFRQNNAQSRPQQQQQQQQLPLKSSSSSERVPINDVLDKWRQMNTLKKKPIHNSVVPAQGQKPTTVLDLDQIMENDLENQLKQMEIQPKPKITLKIFTDKKTSMENNALQKYINANTSYTHKVIIANKFINLFKIDPTARRTK